MSDIPTPSEVATAPAAIDVSSRPQFAVGRGDLETAAAMIRRLNMVLRRPLERVDHDDGSFIPRMFDGLGDGVRNRDLRYIAASHGYSLCLRGVYDFGDLDDDADFSARLAHAAPKKFLDDGSELHGAWETEDGDLVLAYLKPAGAER